MEKEFEKLLEFWKNNEGTGKLFNFKFLEYKKGYLKLEAEFGPSTLNPNKNVQGGQMTSMLDDATSILVVLDTGGKSYPNSTNLHSLHHRPLFQEKVTVVAETIKIGNSIATLKGEIYNSENKLATTLMHSLGCQRIDDIRAPQTTLEKKIHSNITFADREIFGAMVSQSVVTKCIKIAVEP